MNFGSQFGKKIELAWKEPFNRPPPLLSESWLNPMGREIALVSCIPGEHLFG